MAGRKIAISSSVIIYILLAAIVVMVGLTAQRFIVSDDTISPVELEIRELSKFVNKNPGALEERLKLAYAFQRAKKYDEAREQYKEILRVDPENKAAKYNLGVIELEAGDEKEAEKILKELLAKNPKHLLGAVKLSEIYLEQKKYDDVIKVLDAPIQARPDIIDLHIMKARAYEGKGDKEKAKAEYQTVLKYVPDDQTALDSLSKLK